MASMSSVAKLPSTRASVSIAKAPPATSACSTSSSLRCGGATLPLSAAKLFSENLGSLKISSIAKVGCRPASKGVVTVASLEAGVGVMGTKMGRSTETSVPDLLIVGPGVLGSLVGQLWLKGNEGSIVVGQSNTTTRHEDLKSVGIVPVVKDDPQNTEKFPYVIFCAPPSGSEDYAGEVRAAAERWNGEGSLLFTSSSALYDVNDNSICNEEGGPLVPRGRGPRTDRLLDAEDEILKVGGNVVRLAGLYLLNRGGHTFYLSKGTIDARPDHTLNLIHYEDAASLCITILKGESRGQIYMGCDNSPITRQEMMDAVDKSGKFDQKFKEFTGVDGPLGKKLYNNSTRKATGWKPKYESFPSFLGV
ncbi:unnamed protein product [Calypogeia fissa]